MVSRRKALKMISGVSVGAVATNMRLAGAVHMGTEVSISTWLQDSVKGYLVEPSTAPAAAVLLIHEWWGLNDQIKSATIKFADEGFLALAVDLYNGNVAQTPDEARSLMQNITPDEAEETLKAWIAWLREHPGSNGKVGTVGWCFGGGWSLNASISTPVDATVIYYGRCAKSAEETASLVGPVMGHFATRDQFIDREMVEGFEKAMDASNKQYQNFWYEADHAFANPSGDRHDAEDAALAWSRTVEFLRTSLT